MNAFEILVSLVVFFLPLLVISLLDLRRVMRFFIPESRWLLETSRQRIDIPQNRHAGGHLLLQPFSVKRIPEAMRKVEPDEKPTYADLFDTIKANGGVESWVTNSITEKLQGLGCTVDHIEKRDRFSPNFVLYGEVLTVVRSEEIGQVAFKVRLALGNKNFLTKIYSATSRPRGAVAMSKSLGLDEVVRRPYIGKSSKRTNQLLNEALDQAIADCLADLKRVVPYLNTAGLVPPNSQVVQQYAG